MNGWHWIGLILIASGITYLYKPNLFRRGIWMKTSIAIRTLSPEKYVAYIRGMGFLYIGLGVASLLYGTFWS